MAMQVGGSGEGPKSDINVTPLVDVMLVLLIIMMIVAPLLQQGVSLTLPVAGLDVDEVARLREREVEFVAVEDVEADQVVAAAAQVIHGDRGVEDFHSSPRRRSRWFRSPRMASST